MATKKTTKTTKVLYIAIFKDVYDPTVYLANANFKKDWATDVDGEIVAILELPIKNVYSAKKIPVTKLNALDLDVQ